MYPTRVKVIVVWRFLAWVACWRVCGVGMYVTTFVSPRGGQKCG